MCCGQMEKAVHAFEEAIADKTYYLSDSASVDYQRAVGAVAQGTSEQNQATQVLQLADMSGLDVAADGTSVYDEGAYEGGDVSEAFYYDEGTYEADPASFPGTWAPTRTSTTTGSSRPPTPSSSSGRAVWPSRIASAATWV